ncbi:hypothetical protein F0919_17960 [Taibaiella lutea]|uniref:Uncharacterized protein n=1 Tax=Taibaiella lutea TaxID=2608001 RepID=A0A5M6CC12_9BACT|nr:hypothetical protein [Taibaiella lutea]KAA5532667.1 hypothetical protein F0919_17960 [Taibaiella lutea]
MAATIKPIIELLQKRMNNRIDALTAISSSSLENIPESVQQKREDEASKIRAIIQEQKDLIEIINMLYPSS